MGLFLAPCDAVVEGRQCTPRHSVRGRKPSSPPPLPIPLRGAEPLLVVAGSRTYLRRGRSARCIAADVSGQVVDGAMRGRGLRQWTGLCHLYDGQGVPTRLERILPSRRSPAGVGCPRFTLREVQHVTAGMKGVRL